MDKYIAAYIYIQWTVARNLKGWVKATHTIKDKPQYPDAVWINQVIEILSFET